MKIVHILKDGTKLKEISGKVVSAKQFPALYALVASINERRMSCTMKSLTIP